MSAVNRPARTQTPRSALGQRWFGSLTRRTVTHFGLLAAVIAMIWTAVLLHLSEERKQYEKNAFIVADNLARGFGESIRSTFDAIDNFELMLRSLYRADPANFDLTRLPYDNKMDERLTLQIAITDARGIVTSTNVVGGMGVNLADREHVKVQINNRGDFLYIGKPLLGRLSKVPSLQFTRKLYNQNGEFAGVLIISVSPLSLIPTRNNAAEELASISLVGLSDGIIRVRGPEWNMILGLKVPEDQINRIRSGPDRDSYLNVSPVDGSLGFFAYSKIPVYGMAASATLPVEHVFAAYEKDRSRYLLAGAFGTLGVLLAGLMLIQQNQRLLDSQRALDLTIANIGQGIVMHDAAGVVRMINQRAANFLGLPAHLARPGVSFRQIMQWLLDRGELERRGQDTVDLAALIRAGGAEPDQYERELRNGMVIDVRARKLPDGSVVRTYGDVTHRKRNERALASARDAAEAARRTQADFLAVMSHEIRTPMNGVIGMAGLLLDSDLSPTQRRFAGTLREAATSLMQVINDVLDFSKLEASQMEFESIPFDIAAVIGSVVDLMQVKAQERQLWLRTEIAPKTPTKLIGDPGRIRQILLNLVGNATKFTNEGGITISCDGDQQQDGSINLRITVRDTGIGIPLEAQPHLFEQFFQVDASTSRNFGGTGLGLAICRRLTERMGGRISVESAPGVGSAFRIEIPLGVDTSDATGSEDAEPEKTPFVSSGKTMRKLRILLAEDNMTNRLVAVTRLEMFGHRVDEAASGVEALHMVQTVPYDLLLMDVMMPEMDGLECSRRIRALSGPERNIPIVAMTANVFAHHREACRAAGMDDFLGKPFTPVQLERVIERAIAGKLRASGQGDQAGTEDDIAAFLRFAADINADDAIALLDAFADEVRERIGRMRNSATAPDGSGLGADAQAIQEAAGSLGMTHFAAMAGQIHAMPQAETLTDAVAVLASTMETMVAALRPAVLGLSRGG